MNNTNITHRDVFIHAYRNSGINPTLVINAMTRESHYENIQRSIPDLMGYTGNTNMPV